MTTLPKTWPFPSAPPVPLTEKELRDIMLREADKAPY